MIYNDRRPGSLPTLSEYTHLVSEINAAETLASLIYRKSAFVITDYNNSSSAGRVMPWHDPALS